MRKSIPYILSALLLAACGSASPGATSATAKVQSAAVPKIRAMSIHTSRRQGCLGRTASKTYAFGAGTTTSCNNGLLELTVRYATPRYVGTPVAISLDDVGWAKPVTVNLTAGTFKPVSPWIEQEHQQNSGVPTVLYSLPPAFTTFHGSITTSAIAPLASASIPAQSASSTLLAAWLWTPATSASTVTIAGLRPIQIPVAVARPHHLTVSSAFAKTVTVGLSLSTNHVSASAAASAIKAEGISGTITASTTGNPQISPSIAVARPETLQGQIYRWSNPKPGQTLTVSDVVHHVPFYPVAAIPDAQEGSIQILQGLDLSWHQGGFCESVTPQGRSTCQLTISAPAHAKAGQNVLATANLTRNGKPWLAQPISISTSQAQSVSGKTSNFGGYGHLFSHVKAGKLQLTARSGALVATATVLVTNPFPWWLLIIIIAAALILIAETLRRYRKRHQRKAATNQAEGSEPASAELTESARRED